VVRALVPSTSSSMSRDDSDSGVDDWSDWSVVGEASVESTADCNTNIATHAKTARPHAESDIFLVVTRKAASEMRWIFCYKLYFVDRTAWENRNDYVETEEEANKTNIQWTICVRCLFTSYKTIEMMIIIPNMTSVVRGRSNAIATPETNVLRTLRSTCIKRIEN